ncbi:endonuclease/exonuclease/phosphatase family protein [Primorskyibacter sp. 2E233]|uniref:endonuclease/exonuclease/phosphatase family protein n=1 Tax=Primorskyibacter sp. 2E233 TaxID=3413431 RepID=UPI003BF1541C
MRIASLNMQNMRLLSDGGPHLFGARDRDDTEDAALDAEDRRLTAELLARTGADVVAMQEVFDQKSLDFFHDRHLVPLGMEYPFRLCLPGNDGRGLDLAVMARRPWDSAQSHAGLSPEELGQEAPEGIDPALPIFRRDCLEVRFGDLSLFVVHFKAPYPDAAKAWEVRRLEAQAVAHLVGQAGPLWLVAGDLNEPDGQERAVAPLEALGVNLLARLPDVERWTYFDPHARRYHGPDGLIASPALAARYPDVLPEVLRCGLGRETARYHGPRLAGTGWHRPHASDHAAVVAEFRDLY